MKLFELIGHNIKSENSKKNGYVLAVCAESNAITCLICTDENEREFKVDWRDVHKNGDTLTFFDRKESFKKAKPIVLGKSSFDTNGRYLGKIVDYECVNGKLTKVYIGKKAVDLLQVTVGDIAIVTPHPYTKALPLPVPMAAAIHEEKSK